MPGLQPAVLPVVREKEFEELKGAIARSLSAANVEEFLKRVKKSGTRVRQFDLVLGGGVFERVDQELAKSGRTAKMLYGELPVSDQAQIREFYLSKVEEVEPALRTKFQKLYQYY
ncbi:MAG TPA: hypothetical protein VFA68_06205 [Terriglobales bacterium]|nr:hypothetical protein [Terriglobales bacterium]